MWYVVVVVVVVANCAIKAKSYARDTGLSNTWGCSERIGFVRLNGKLIWRKSWCGVYADARGVTIIKIEPFNCTRISTDTFDNDDANGANDLRDYLDGLADGEVIIGVTGEDPSYGLDNALDALSNFGVDVSDVGEQGSFSFVGEKGSSTKTKLDKKTSVSWHDPAFAQVTVRGKCKVS